MQKVKLKLCYWIKEAKYKEKNGNKTK